MKEPLDTHYYRTLGKDLSILVVWRVTQSQLYYGILLEVKLDIGFLMGAVLLKIHPNRCITTCFVSLKKGKAPRVIAERLH